ncbi:MAG: hypothetical protein Q8Q78_11880 [Hydrogenophaga sp.]|nr:hypothetical protein [Hydrogenophaga sp.]
MCRPRSALRRTWRRRHSNAAHRESDASLPNAAATPDTATTLLEVCDRHLSQHTEQVLITFYETGDEAVELSYAARRADAQAVAAGPQARWR